MLRDLMYVARPPEPRPRSCQPDEIWRSSLRDARPVADDRGVHLACDGLDGGQRAWADPDGLRHLADALLRNAIEATPRGGSVRVTSVGQAVALGWSVHDTGRGISPSEGAHLFDPFYCGRQAGRGLGMGLPRLARFLELAGGEIRWQTVQGQGATFLVRMPLAEPPRPPPLEPLAPTGPDSDRPAAAFFKPDRSTSPGVCAPGH
jgi:signal transduction histidine kinase